MVTIQRHNGLARTGLDVVAQLKGYVQQSVVYGSQMGFAAGVLSFDIFFSGLEVSLRIAIFGPLTRRSLG